MEEPKKYFIKDESIHGVDNDKFNYNDISNLLEKIIKTNKPPFNVAIIGKWGLGKSSLINMVMDRCKQEDVFIQEINAWKYEKESLRKVFLKQLWQSLSHNTCTSIDTIASEVASVIQKDALENTAEKKKNSIKFWLSCLAGAVALFLIMGLYKQVQYWANDVYILASNFWAETFLSYCKNIGTILLAPVLICGLKFFFTDYKNKQTKKFELKFPLETTDDYEIFLETEIKKYLSKHSDLKIITVIDDLDRLSINKIVEALDAIKAFVGFERCIFVVPFDDEIIKQALDKRRVKEFNDGYDVVESELILDKLFQFKVYLPPLLKFDIQKYAFELIKKEVPDFLNDFCNEQLAEKVIKRVLIHSNVTTPRQVKKLLNAFINNCIIAFQRVNSGRVEAELLTSEVGIMQIAKLSVLQADFNSFYDLLYTDMSCIDTLLTVHRENTIDFELPVYLKSYFDRKPNGSEGIQYTIKKEFEPLINFLISTNKYHVPSIAPYLYLAQDDISIQTGDALQRRVTEALISGNDKTVRNLLTQNSGIAEVIIRNVFAEQTHTPETIGVAITVYDSVSEEYTSRLAQRIIERTLELDYADRLQLYQAPADNVFYISEKGENNDFNGEFLQKYLSIFLDTEYFEKEPFLNMLKVAINRLHHLKVDIRDDVIKIAAFAMQLNDLLAPDLYECVDATDRADFMDVWGESWFSKLYNYIESQNDFSKEVKTHLIDVVSSLIELKNSDAVCQTLLNLRGYAEFFPILSALLDIKKIATEMSVNTATSFAMAAIECDFEHNQSILTEVLIKLPFNITDTNNTVFDDFFADNLIEEQQVFLKIASQENVDSLPKTAKRLINLLFMDENVDELFRHVCNYFTGENTRLLFQTLYSRCSYRSDASYERELKIIKILSETSIFDQNLNTLFESYLISGLNSYYDRDNYVNFAGLVAQIIKDHVKENTVESYVSTIVDYVFRNSNHIALMQLKRLNGIISEKSFVRVFDKITSDCRASDFDAALEIILDNSSKIPSDQTHVDKYYEFLLNNLATTSNPDRVIEETKRYFCSIERIDTFVENALKNKETTQSILVESVYYFIKQEESENRPKNILDIYQKQNETNIVNAVFAIAQDDFREDVLNSLTSVVTDALQSTVLIKLANLSCNYLHLDGAVGLLLKCLEVALKSINKIHCAKSILYNLLVNKEKLKNYKLDLANVLRDGFIATDSDELKTSILNAVREFKIKPAFKKGLEGDDMVFYKHWNGSN